MSVASGMGQLGSERGSDRDILDPGKRSSLPDVAGPLLSKGE